MPLPMTIKVSRLIGVTREFIAVPQSNPLPGARPAKKNAWSCLPAPGVFAWYSWVYGVICPDCAVRFTHPGRYRPMVDGDHRGFAAEGLAAVARAFAGSVPKACRGRRSLQRLPGGLAKPRPRGPLRAMAK